MNQTDSKGRLPTWLAPWLSWRHKRFWLLIAAITYTLCGFLLTPWLVERTVTQRAVDIGRTATIGEIRTNPYTFTLDMREFELRDVDQKPLVTLDHLWVDFEMRSLIDWAFNFKLLRLDRLTLFEERFDTVDTRLVRLLTDLAPPEDPEAAEDELPPRAIIQRLEVLDTRLAFIDRAAEDFEGQVGPVTVEVDDIRTIPDHTGRQTVVIQLNEEDRISWQGDLQLVPFRSNGRVALRAREMPNTRRYMDHYLPFDLIFNRVTADFIYTASLVNDSIALTVSDFTGAVDELAVQYDDSDVIPVTINRVQAEGGAFDYPRQAARLEHLLVDGLGVTASLREDGSIDLLDLLPPAPADAGPAVAGEAPLTVDVDLVTVTGDAIDLQDRTVAPAADVGLRGFTVTVQNVNLEDGTAMPVNATASLASGGDIGFDGAVTAFPALMAEGRISADALALAVAQPYVASHLRVQIENGLLDLTGDARHSPEQPLAVAGELTVRELAIDDVVRSERLLAWDALRLDRFEADLAANRVETSTLFLEGLYGRFHIAEDRTTNVSELLVAPAQPSAEAPMPTMTIGGVRLDDMSLDFSDSSLPLPFAAAIRDMDGDISTLSTITTEPAEIALEGQVNEFGLARINGSVVPLEPLNQTSIQMTFRNLEIARLSPYSISFAGYAIETGRLDTDLSYVLDNGLLQGDNGIVIREMQLGEKSDHPDAGNLPLGLAVALLKDAEGVIDLDVPVEGDLNNPEFRIGGVILQAIGNLITRAVTAPFRLLGNLVGVDSEDFGTLSFQPGSADVSPPDREQLLKLAEAMTQRPELALEVSGSWLPALDAPALREARLDGDLKAWQAANPGDEDELSTQRERRAVEALFGTRFPSDPLDGIAMTHRVTPPENPEGEAVLDEPAYVAELKTRLTESIDITTADFEALARARAQAVLAVLQGDPNDTTLALTEGNPAEADEEAVEAAEPGAVPLALGVSIRE